MHSELFLLHFQCPKENGALSMHGMDLGRGRVVIRERDLDAAAAAPSTRTGLIYFHDQQ